MLCVKLRTFQKIIHSDQPAHVRGFVGGKAVIGGVKKQQLEGKTNKKQIVEVFW